MRINAVTIGAVTLGSHVMAQGSKPIKEAASKIDRIDIPEAFTQLGEWKLDACHKVDSQVDDFIWPCASKMRTEMALCPTNPTTAEEREAQRQCLCGEGSSLLQDAAACVQCKRENGLQADSHKQFWSDYYKEVDEKYCKVPNPAESYGAFIAALNQRRPEPAAGNNLNRLIGVVADPKSYYETAGVEVPKKQGAGKVTPAAPKADNGKNSSVPVTTATAAPVATGAPVAPVIDQVKVPVIIAVADQPAAGQDKTSTSSISSAPFKNGTATIRPTPSTFVTITTSSSASTGTTSLLPATTLAPGNVNGPVEEHIIDINGKPCRVYIVWVIVDCIPKFDANGNFAIGFVNKGVDKQEPPKMVEDKKQFDQVKEVICDGGKDEKLAEQAKEHVGTEGTVVQAPSDSKKQELPPVKQTAGDSKVPSSGKQPTDGVKPVNNEEECEVVDDVSKNTSPETGKTTPQTGKTTPQTGKTTPQTGKTTPETGKTTPETGKTTPQTGKTTPQTGKTTPETGKTTPETGKTTPETGKTTPQTGVTPGSNTCECECPSTVATAFSSSSSEDPEICQKKVETETACKQLSGRQMWECLCSQGEYFEKTHFFKEAVQCERRKSNLRESEFEAQILFEVNYRYCQKQLFDNDFGAAYSSVSDEWRASRAPGILV
ncbi:Envelope glycoprotein GP350 [Beauveria bassiana]|uniref:Envelope glycoprotein GP350 n=1 Tax=Beauveria bassiana TaxID=176275 RepID=A0A2N6NK67_BEABA|nr:Envelope glycoprotein GP350 [Beauveria bassiana]